MTSGIENTDAPPRGSWTDKYPTPKRAAAGLTRDEVLGLLRDGATTAGRDFVLVDVRRNDHEGGTIRGSINLPAQSLFPSIPTVYETFKAAGVKRVIWYCGSCNGRGPRAAGWFADYIDSKGDTSMQSLILEGGIKGWVAAGEQFVQSMDEYDEACWR